MTSRFATKTVIVTGASEGVGAAAAKLFHKEGARVKKRYVDRNR
jgi:NAD(P)-dependent dehydrogenase (short-subunit alcohol dehydrogenase family)